MKPVFIPHAVYQDSVINRLRQYYSGGASVIRPIKMPSWIWSDSFADNYLIEETLCIPSLNCTLSLISPTEKYIEDHYDDYYDLENY